MRATHKTLLRDERGDWFPNLNLAVVNTEDEVPVVFNLVLSHGESELSRERMQGENDFSREQPRCHLFIEFAPVFARLFCTGLSAL